MEFGGKQKAAMERYFSEIDLDLIENMLIEKLAYGKDAANFKKVFTQKPLLISTFIEHVVTTEFVESSNAGLARRQKNTISDCFIPLGVHGITTA